MWLIRKIVVRRNIAEGRAGIRKLKGDVSWIVGLSERTGFCIAQHKDNTKRVSRAPRLIDRVLDYCLRQRREASIDLRRMTGTGGGGQR